MSQQIQITGGAKVRALEGVITGTSGVLSSVPLGAASGVATLDSGGKVPVSQLPSSVVTYLGTWNAATNTPTLVNGTGDAGDMYICNVAGTVNFGAGPVVFVVGDWVLYGSGTWQKSSGQNGTVTSVGASITGSAIGLTGSPITTAGTLAFAFAGTNLQYVNGAGNLTTFPILTGYVPYTGATANVDLGVYDLTADLITGARGSFASNGGSDTFAINHSSGAGIALNITKGGSGEGLYINKTSGSGNAATIIGTLEATTLVKSGGTSSQFLKADGTVDSNTYALDSAVVHNTGNETIGGTKTFSDATKNNGGIFLQNASSNSLAGYMNIGGLTNGVKFTSGGGVSNTFTLPSATGYTFTFPNATGTLALTSDISYPVTSVFGRTGAVVATSGDYTTAQVTESGNLYFTDSRARLALSFVAGSGAYNSTTGVITIPTNNTQITNGANYITLLSLSSSATGLTYTNTTGVFSLTAGYSIPTTANQTNWTTAYNDSIVSAAVTGTTTKTLTLTQQDAGTITASWTDINTDAVSSVFGRTGAVVAASGDYTTAQVTEVTNLYYTEARVNANTNVAANTAARHNAVTIGTANGLSLSTQALSLALANTTTTGALSSTDWNTFNNKQSALTNPVTGTGAAGRVAYWSSANEITSEADFVWDATNNRLGIGITPVSSIHVGSYSSSRIRLETGATGAALLDFHNDSVARWSIGVDNNQLYGKLENRVLSVDAIRFYDATNNVVLNPTSGKTVIGTATATNHQLTVFSATEAAQVRVAGAAPSVVFTDTLTDPANYVAYFGLATAVNNFITGSVAGDYIFHNYTSNNILFGINNTLMFKVEPSGATTFSSYISATSVYTPQKVSAIYGVGVATTNGNGGSLTVKSGGGYGSTYAGGHLYIGAGRGNSSATNANIYFGTAQSSDISGLSNTYLTIDGTSGTALFTSSVTATSFVKTSGTSSQFLKADGTVDSSTYLTTSSASSTYLPLVGGTLTGDLSIAYTTSNLRLFLNNTTATTGRSWYLNSFSNGNLYIGNTTASDVFNFSSTGAATFSSYVQIGGTTGSDRLNIENSGTTSYCAMRVIHNNATAQFYVGIGGSAVANTALQNNAYLMNAAASSLCLGTSDAVRMTITSGGNVLIGTATDTGGDRRLQVAGDLFVNDNTTTGNGVQLKSADRPLITRGWDAFTSGTKTGVGRWGLFMEAGELFLGSPGTDYTNGIVSIGGYLLNGTKQQNLTVNNYTRNVGIGTASPTGYGRTLQIASPSSDDASFVLGDGTGTSTNRYFAARPGSTANFYFGTDSGSIIFATGLNPGTSIGTERMKITTGGFVQITNTTQTDDLGSMQIYNTTASASANSSLTVKSYNGTGQFMQWENYGMRIGSRIKTNTGAGGVYFTYGADNVGMTITSTGNILIGAGVTDVGSLIHAYTTENRDNMVYTNTNTSLTYAIFAAKTTRSAGTSCYLYYGEAASTTTYRVYNNGNVQNTNNSYTGISDISIKENILDATPKLADLLKVRVVNYNLKAPYENHKQLGVVAQELEKIFPNMIDIDGNTKLKSVKYSIFVPMLIKAVQELKAEIETLKNK